MPPTLFTLSEAQDLQNQDVQAVADYQDEFGRIIIPQGCTDARAVLSVSIRGVMKMPQLLYKLLAHFLK